MGIPPSAHGQWCTLLHKCVDYVMRLQIYLSILFIVIDMTSYVIPLIIDIIHVADIVVTVINIILFSAFLLSLYHYIFRVLCYGCFMLTSCDVCCHLNI